MDFLENTLLQDTVPPSECRTCLKFIDEQTNAFFNLFEPWREPSSEGLASLVAKDVMKLTSITVEKDDGLSAIICVSCYNKVRDACEFINLVRKNDLSKKCVDGLNTADSWPKPIHLEKSYIPDNTQIIGSESFTVKEEIISDDEMLNNPKLDHIDETEIKIEPEELLLTSKQFQEHVKGSLSLEEAKASSNCSTSPAKLNGESTIPDHLAIMIKEEPLDEEENPSLHDLALECMLCSKQFRSLSGLKAHVISQHSYKTIKRKNNNSTSPDKKNGRKHCCNICNRRFVTSTDLMVHETCHNKATCYACNRQFDTFKELTRHRRNCKKINVNNTVKPKALEDVKRAPIDIEVPLLEDDKVVKPLIQLACSKCNEVFMGSYYLKIHQEIHHNSTVQYQTPMSDVPADVKPDEDLLLQSIFGVEK